MNNISPNVIQSASQFVAVPDGEWGVMELIVLGIAAAMLMLILWMVFCACTAVRFVKGTFYKVGFSKNENGNYVISFVYRINPEKKRLSSMLKPNSVLDCLVPFKRRKYSLLIDTKVAHFVAKKPIIGKLFYRTYPEIAVQENKDLYVGQLTLVQCAAVLKWDRNVEFRPQNMEGCRHPEVSEAMHSGRFITENGRTIVLFMSRKEQREFWEWMGEA